MPKKAHRPFQENSKSSSSFPTTRWSQLASAEAGASRAPAFEALARDYFRPVMAYLRTAFRLDEDRARDLAQEFFAMAIERDLLGKADASRGRFRGFLKQSLANFAIDVRRRQSAQRRGGGSDVPSLDADPVAGEMATPDAALDLQWRRELIEGALGAVEHALSNAGKGAQFAIFRDYFLADAGSDDAIDYRTIAQKNGLSLAEISNALQRTKALFKDELRARIVKTVHDEEELRLELEWLFGRGKS